MFRNSSAIILIFFCLFARADSNVQEESVFSPNQTSASLLIRYAEKLKLNTDPANRAEAERKYLLLYDIYIKAR